VHSNAGWLAMGNEFRLHLPLDEDDAYLVASPMSHAAGLLIWPVLTSGARYVIMPGFDPARFLDVIERERCTSAMVVPTMIHMLTGVPGATEFSVGRRIAATGVLGRSHRGGGSAG
jgi:acyl-CoA synthetase (AMP-forming)/AMP-acid ligase II